MGDGTYVSKNFPTFVSNYNGWEKISVSYHVLAIIYGELYAWGDNSQGQIGNNSTTGSNLPIKIGEDNIWTDIATGEESSLAIRNGRLYAWGHNRFGGLGLPNQSYITPTLVGVDTDWEKVFSGMYTTFLIKTNGDLYSMGWNVNGQCGVGTTTVTSAIQQIGASGGWTQVSASDYYALGIRNGNLYAWGNNDYGNLGDGTTTQRLTPTLIGAFSDWEFVSAGKLQVSYGIRNGNLYAWGNNLYGQYGNGTYIDSLTPLLIGVDSDWQKVGRNFQIRCQQSCNF